MHTQGPGVQWCNTIRPNKCLLINGNICASKCDFLFPLFALLGWPTGPLSESRRHSSRSLARSKASESKVLESKAPIRTDGTLASLSLLALCQNWVRLVRQRVCFERVIRQHTRLFIDTISHLVVSSSFELRPLRPPDATAQDGWKAIQWKAIRVWGLDSKLWSEVVF